MGRAAYIFFIAGQLAFLLKIDASRIKAQSIISKDAQLEAMSKEDLIAEVKTLSSTLADLEKKKKEDSMNEDAQQEPRKEKKMDCYCDQNGVVQGGRKCWFFCSCNMRTSGAIEMKGMFCPGGE
mmetsp:Transcript_118867/g.186522  ORF Transcript_118867/g.186522 Transcript_118867/m.186522 type:complete len:124 (-) Transcript_118867:94-465(-)